LKSIAKKQVDLGGLFRFHKSGAETKGTKSHKPTGFGEVNDKFSFKAYQSNKVSKELEAKI